MVRLYSRAHLEKRPRPFLLSLTGGAISDLEFALDVLDEGNKLWATVPYDTRGNGFRPSLTRMFQTELLRLRQEGHALAQSDSARKAFSLDKVEEDALALIAGNQESEWITQDRTNGGTFAYHVGSSPLSPNELRPTPLILSVPSCRSSHSQRHTPHSHTSLPFKAVNPFVPERSRVEKSDQRTSKKSKRPLDTTTWHSTCSRMITT